MLIALEPSSSAHPSSAMPCNRIFFFGFTSAPWELKLSPHDDKTVQIPRLLNLQFYFWGKS